jgi:hypothetical protein
MYVRPCWYRARWIFVLIFAISALSVGGEARDITHKRNADAGCVFMGSAVEGLNQWSIGGQQYTRVFTGIVRSVEDISDSDKRLELVPDEAFVGDQSDVTATIREACLSEDDPELKVGDRWLFYIRPKPYVDEISHHISTRGFEIPWYGPSKPASEALDDIATLRRRGELTEEGILTGHVFRIGETVDNLNPTAVPNHRVIAKDLGTGTEYIAFTDSKGRFEFELPHGHYEVSASTKQGLRDAEPFAEDANALAYGLGGNAVVRQRDWTEIADFRLVVDGRLAGQVTAADGHPASFAKVAIIPISPVRPQFIVDADENGHFEVDGRQPGKYLVGVGLLAPFDSAEWRSRVYYPGVASKDHAKVIELGDGEWRTDVNFKLLQSR